MRSFLAPLPFLCLIPNPAPAMPLDPGCVRVLGSSGYECVSRSRERQVRKSARAGGRTDARQTKLAALPFSPGLFAGGGSVIAVMQRYEGRNPTGWKRNWCAEMLNRALREAGYAGTGSAASASFRNYGSPAPAGAVGSIAVMRGHVGVVTGRCADGRIEMISGNSGGRSGARTVATGCYAPSRIVAYRWPR